MLKLFLAPAFAFTFDLEGSQFSGAIVQLLLLFSVLSLAPSILIMATSFTRLVVVLSFLRSALGLQQAPPNMVMISLALFLTGFIMMPTLQESYEQGVRPLVEQKVTLEEALPRIAKPFHQFMLHHVREEDLRTFSSMAKVEQKLEDVPYQILVPAFMISELRRAFEIGFLLFIPFLIIDMVVSSILMSMGMMMLPPVTISLPFKIIFFVLVDGWRLLSSSLIQSYGMTPT